MDRGREGRSDSLVRVGYHAGSCGGKAALTEPWPNGKTERQNTKFKLVKRPMYSQAKLDLLRARLLGAL
jgi:hypothetical protein